MTCTPTSRYKVLSILFDGVPVSGKKTEALTDSVAPDSTLSEKSPPPRVVKPLKNSFHPYYQQKSCDRCHDVYQGYCLKERQPTLCYQCHADFRDEYNVLHGPVAAGYCNSCHHPHSSKNKKLLNHKIEQLCLYCHEWDDVSKNNEHEEINKSSCMDCHNPHGDDDCFILN